jgi:CBS domain containing-hemolysin-like protein
MLVIFFCLILLALVSMAEAAMVSVNKVRLRSLAEAGNRSARLVDKLTDDRHSLLASLIITLNGCLLVISAFSTDLFLRFADEKWLPLLSLAMIFLILSVFEVTPKALGLRRAERIALFFARPAAALIWLLSPLIWVMTRFGRAILRAFVVPVLGGEIRGTFRPLTDDEIKQLLVLGQKEGEIEAEERELLHSAIEFANKVAREVMVPRTDMVCLAEASSVSEAIEVSTRSGFSRIPVYRGDLDHIVGVLYVRDLLATLIEGQKETPVSSLMRPPFLVPESIKIDELLRDMQGRRTHMAIIIDEHGGVSGLVTIEDLLEEIVGEIRDEYDIAEEEPIRMFGADVAIAQGRISPDEIAEHFSVNLPEGEFDTLGGFLIDQLGRLPEAGDKIQYGPLLFEITRVHQQRIERVRIARIEEKTADEAEE